MNHMGKVIYLDWFRPQEPKPPPNTLCGGMQAPYVVDPSINPYLKDSDGTLDTESPLSTDHKPVPWRP